MAGLNVQWYPVYMMNTSGSRKHLLGKTRHPICLCLPKISLITPTMQLMSFVQGKQRGSTNCATALEFTPWFVHTVHLGYPATPWQCVACLQTLREKLSRNTVAYILSKLVVRKSQALVYSFISNEARWAWVNSSSVPIQGERTENTNTLPLIEV